MSVINIEKYRSTTVLPRPMVSWDLMEKPRVDLPKLRFVPGTPEQVIEEDVRAWNTLLSHTITDGRGFYVNAKHFGLDIDLATDGETVFVMLCDDAFHQGYMEQILERSVEQTEIPKVSAV